MVVPEFPLGSVTVRPLTRTEPECSLVMLIPWLHLSSSDFGKAGLGLGIYINPYLGGF